MERLFAMPEKLWFEFFPLPCLDGERGWNVIMLILATISSRENLSLTWRSHVERFFGTNFAILTTTFYLIPEDFMCTICHELVNDPPLE